MHTTRQVGWLGEGAAHRTIEAQLYDPSGKPVFKEPLASPVGPAKDQWGRPAGTLNEVTLEQAVRAPELWSAESPALYTLVVTLKTPGGEESVSCRIGFRKV